ncbi:predicted protein [Botrytis cinerea T4]|uniref:Uncharacterized protein n=1 Tax=Botryotinia fuckeliana (strain T4) TaxID=999810 RepID=G2YIJ1_BOTF4|nr:predicted protein [Botrytis cinerea T4]
MCKTKHVLDGNTLYKTTQHNTTQQLNNNTKCEACSKIMPTMIKCLHKLLEFVTTR